MQVIILNIRNTDRENDMAISINLNTISSGYNLSKINENFTTIETALADALSREGTSPNEMGADLDLNGNDLLNGGIGNFESLNLGGSEIVTSDLFAKGDSGWSPIFAVVSDSSRRVLQLVGYSGGQGDVPTDNIGYYVGSSGYVSNIANGVDIRGAQGTSGAGSGDMVSTNNLSDVANPATAFSNIKQASTTSATGVVELATSAETQTGTDTARAVTPSGLASVGYAKLATENQTVSGGAGVTPKNLGTVSSGTLTPDPSARPMQYYTNNGAHTLAPHGSVKGTYVLEILNGASAGAITTSGWTNVSGTFSTTASAKFHCMCIVGQLGSSLTIKAI